MVPDVRQSVTSFAADAGFVGPDLDDLGSWVSEAITNAIVHAYRDGRAPGTVVVHAEFLSPTDLIDEHELPALKRAANAS
jgi:anti-sigma regulatory factor (Ser/Thr protein kinase)